MPGAHEIRAAAALTASFVATDAVAAGGHDKVHLLVDVQAAGDVTELQVDAQVAFTAGPPAAADWATVQEETGAANPHPLVDYVLSKAIGGAVKVPVVYPVIGEWFRLRLRASAGTGAGSLVVVQALSRKLRTR